MAGGADDETDPDAIAALGPGEGPEDDLVHLGAGTEQETAVERPAGHFDQGALIWDEANSSAHAPIRRKKWPPLTNLYRPTTSAARGNRFHPFREAGRR